MDLVKFVKEKGSFNLLPLGVGSVLAGTGAAALRGNMELLCAIICLLFAVVTQIGFSYFHYYTAAVGSSRKARHMTLMSRGMENYPIAVRVLSEASSGCLILSMMLGIAIAGMSSSFLASVGIGCVLYGLCYLMVFGPKLYRTIWALVITFIVFGPIGIGATCIEQSQHEATGSIWNYYDAAPAIFLAPAMGLLALTNHWISSLGASRVISDQVASLKFTKGAAARLGDRGVAAILVINGLVALGLIIWMTFSLHIQQALIAIVPMFCGCALNTFIAFSIPGANVAKLTYLGGLSRVSYLLTGFLVFVLWWIIGAPDDSVRVLF